MAISVEIRRLAVKAYEDGVGCYEEVANLFDVGSASLKRWMARYRESGSIDPLPHGGGTEHRIDDEGAEFIKGLLTERPDISLEEICRRYNRQYETDVSVSTVGRCVRARLNFRRKKKPTGPRSKMRRTCR